MINTGDSFGGAHYNVESAPWQTRLSVDTNDLMEPGIQTGVALLNQPNNVLEQRGLLPATVIVPEMASQVAAQIVRRPEAAIAGRVGQLAVGAGDRPLERDIARLEGLLNPLFTQIDTNRNGFITTAELNAAMRNPNLSREQAMLVALLKEMSEQIAPLNDDGWFTGSQISRTDLNRLIGMWRSHLNGTEHPLIETAISNMQQYRSRLEISSRSLYANADNPLASTVPVACLQPDHVGNCHFVAAMASLAAVNPQAIRDMIRDNNNGTYTVTFPHQTPITVDAPTEAELAHYGTGGAHGIWSTILQMAYGSYWSPRGESPLEGAGGSIRNDGMRVISGMSAETYTMSLTGYSTLDAGLESCMNSPQHRPAVVRFNSLFGQTDPGLVSGHAYSVIGYNRDANDVTQSTITVRNPWGSNPSAPLPEGITDLGNGTIRMTLQTLNNHCSSVSFARQSLLRRRGR